MDLGRVAKCTLRYTTDSTPRRHSNWTLLATLTVCTASFSLSQPRVVLDTESLYAALDDGASHISLANNITITSSKGSGSWPLLLSRDCLVDGAPGRSYPRLDFNFATNDRVRLGPGVKLTFRGLSLVNVISRTQLSLDFFAQSASMSSIVWEDIVDRRSICPPLQVIKDAWSRAPRPADVGGALQQEIVEGPSCDGAMGCHSMDVLRSFDAVAESSAGYRLRLNNTLTVCEQYISQACIKDLGTDTCYLVSLEALLSSGITAGSSPSLGSASRSLSSGAQAGVIAGCAVGGVLLLLLLLVALLWCRNRRFRGADGNGNGAPAFSASVLDATSEMALPAFGSSASGETSATNVLYLRQIPQNPQHWQLQQQSLHHAKPGIGGKLRGECRTSHETNSTDMRPTSGALVAAALESGESSPSVGGLRPSGSGTRDAPHGSSGTHPPSLVLHTQHSRANLSRTPQPAVPSSATYTSVQTAGGSVIGHSTHSLSSILWSRLRSMLSRTESHTVQSHQELDTGAVTVTDGAGRTSSEAMRGGALVSSGMPSATAVTAGITSGLPPAVLRSRAAGVWPSGRGSSGGQEAVASVSSRPSIGEMQQELERMEDQWTRETKVGNGRKSLSSSLSRSERSQRGGAGGGGSKAPNQRS